MCKHTSFYTYNGITDTVKICQECGTYWTGDGFKIEPTDWSMKYVIPQESTSLVKKNRYIRRYQRRNINNTIDKATKELLTNTDNNICLAKKWYKAGLKKSEIRKLLEVRPVMFGATNTASVFAWIRTFKGFKALKHEAQPKKNKLVLKVNMAIDKVKQIALFVGFNLDLYPNIKIEAL